MCVVHLREVFQSIANGNHTFSHREAVVLSSVFSRLDEAPAGLAKTSWATSGCVGSDWLVSGHGYPNVRSTWKDESLYAQLIRKGAT